MTDFMRASLVEHGRTIMRVHEYQRGFVYHVMGYDRLNQPEDAPEVYRILEELISEGVIRKYNRNNHASLTVWEKA